MRHALKNSIQILSIFIFLGCLSTKKIEKPNNYNEKVFDKSKALELYLKASELEDEGKLAESITIYKEALNYDDADAIYFAIAKNSFRIENLNDAIFYSIEATKKDPLNKEYYYLLSDALVLSQKYDSALVVYKNILAIDSTDFGSQHAVAIFTEKKDPIKALSIYEKILPFAPNQLEIYLKMAAINYGLKRFQISANLYNKMIQLQPNNNLLKEELGNIYITLNKLDSAEKIFTDLHDQNKNDLVYHDALSEIYLIKQNWKDAKPHLDFLLQSDSLPKEIRWKIAIAYFIQSEKDSSLLDETKNQLNEFDKLYPNDWRAKFYLGIININNIELATTYFDSVTKLASWNLDAWLNLSYLHFQKKEYSQIIKILTSAKKIFPKESKIYFYLGLAFSQSEKHSEAIANFEQAKKLDTNNIKVYSSLGFSYDAIKNFSKSDSAYNKAIELDSNDAVVLNNYSYSLAERNTNLKSALAMSKKSILLDSLNSSFFDTIGWIYFQLGDYNKAKENIAKAINLESEENPTLFEHLGDVYEKLDNKNLALEFWMKAYKLKPDSKELKVKLKIK